MPKYLLPCSCGQNVPVGVHQAGLSVACACGKQLEVPTRRGITQLELQADEGMAPSASSVGWGLRQRVMLLGIVFLVPALLTWAVLRATWPSDAIGPMIAAAEPVEAVEWWQALKHGVDTRDNPASVKFVARIQAYTVMTYVSYGAAAMGGVLILVSLFIAGSTKVQTVKQRSAR
jgi:hypothetical protein